MGVHKLFSVSEKGGGTFSNPRFQQFKREKTASLSKRIVNFTKNIGLSICIYILMFKKKILPRKISANPHQKK